MTTPTVDQKKEPFHIVFPISHGSEKLKYLFYLKPCYYDIIFTTVSVYYFKYGFKAVQIKTVLDSMVLSIFSYDKLRFSYQQYIYVEKQKI